MNRKELLQRIRYHWYSYVARGGFEFPSPVVGYLSRGGIEHWTFFLQLGRKYVREHKKNWADLFVFLPRGMIMLLTGESRHEFRRRFMAYRMALVKRTRTFRSLNLVPVQAHTMGAGLRTQTAQLGST